MTASDTLTWQVHPGRRIHTFGRVFNVCLLDLLLLQRSCVCLLRWRRSC